MLSAVTRSYEPFSLFTLCVYSYIRTGVDEGNSRRSPASSSEAGVASKSIASKFPITPSPSNICIRRAFAAGESLAWVPADRLSTKRGRERERERESLGIQTVGLSVQFQSAHTALSELSEANKNTESFTATDKWHPALRRALASLQTSRFSFHFYSFPLLLQISVDIPKQRLFFFFLFVFFFCRFLPRE